MKTNLVKAGLLMAASAAVFTFASSAQAQPVEGEPYWHNPYETVWKDPYGKCIRTINWAANRETPECGGAVIAKAAPPEPVIQEFTLSADAFFDFDKATLKPEGKAELSRLADKMRTIEAIQRISVVGHTDSIGTEAYNQALSERRAASVKNYLVSEGIRESWIDTRGEGESNPIAPNTTPTGRDNPAGRAQNRRVEITVEAREKVMRQ